MEVSQQRSVYVWDAPTRLFHWMLAILILVAWFTGEGEGIAAYVHRAAGSVVAGLIVFRALWGFLGGEHARFCRFRLRAGGRGASPARARPGQGATSSRPQSAGRHRGLSASGHHKLHRHHGTISAGDDNAGPFAGVFGVNLSELHEGGFRVLQVLVSLHLIGVVVESLATKDALARAMITGVKHRATGEAGADARRASLLALLIATAAGLGIVIALMAAPQSPPVADSSEDAYRIEFD